MSKIDILKRAIIGEAIKLESDLFWKNKLSKINTQNRIGKLTVSLTSYGDRVDKIVPYTVLSIMKQTVRPSRVVLWLDKTNWNDNNIPQKLKDLKRYGLEVGYCTDIRSYTKLIPTLKEYPDNIIVTVDDDLYYSHNFLEELYSQHLKEPSKIITLNFCYPSFNNNILNTYRKWNEYHSINDDKQFSKMLIFPQGFGGVLYPSGSLYKDVLNENVFLKYAPYADDIWFYIMRILKGSEKQCVLNSKTKYYFLDLFRQIKARDRLHDLNVGESKNDIQLEALLSYYNISLKDYE